MSNSPSDAKARAARMAAFSSKVKDEEDAAVSVRSFNEAKSGFAGTQEFDPKTGAVRPGGGGAAAPPPKANVKTISDDELFAEIDAAVEAEEKKIGKSVSIPNAPEPEAAPARPAAPQGLSAKRLAAMAAAIERDAIPEPDTPARKTAAALSDLGDVEVQRPVSSRPQAMATADEAFEVNAPKPKGVPTAPVPMAAPEELKFQVHKPSHAVAAGSGKSSAGAFEVRKDATEAKQPLKLKSPAEDEFLVKLDKEEKEIPDLLSPADTEYAVKSDAQSRDLASSAGEKVKELVEGVKPIELPHRASKPAPAPLVKSHAETRRDTSVRANATPLGNIGSGSVAIRRDAEAKPLPRMHGAGDEPAAVRQDAASKPLPKMRSAADTESFVARLARETGEMPRILNPADQPMEAKRDRTESRDAPRMLNLADARPDVRHDKEIRAPPRILSPADTMRPDVRMDKETRAAPKIHSPADTMRPDVKHDKETRAALRIESPADTMRPEVRHDKETRAAPRIESPADTMRPDVRHDKETRAVAPNMPNLADVARPDVRHDKETRAAPRIFNPADTAKPDVRHDKETRAVAPNMPNLADVARPDVRHDKETRATPRIVSPADAQSYDVKRDAEAKPLPRMNSISESTYAVKKDAEAKPLPKMSSISESTYAVKKDAEAKPLPKFKSPADAEAYEAKMAWERKELPKMRSAADTEQYDTKQDRETRERSVAHNPGQSEFEVKMEHESVWTTPLRRDIPAEEGKAAKKENK